MATVPFNFGQGSSTGRGNQGPMSNPFSGGNFDFGNLPFNFSPFGGMDNGLNLAGAWASGGFNTLGQPPQSGWQSFFGQGNSSSTGTSPFGVPQTNFPANGIGSIPFSTGSTFAGGGSSFPGFPQLGTKSLDKLYGKDVGRALTGFLNSGAGFNPQVVQAQIDAAMPIEAHTVARLQSMFGNVGNAYSSTAALGVGDFESQFNASLEGIFAQEYEQSVQNYINILTGTLAPAKQQEQAQKPSFLDIAGNIASAVLGFF